MSTPSLPPNSVARDQTSHLQVKTYGYTVYAQPRATARSLSPRSRHHVVSQTVVTKLGHHHIVAFYLPTSRAVPSLANGTELFVRVYNCCAAMRVFVGAKLYGHCVNFIRNGDV